jgi:hypothetical protein
MLKIRGISNAENLLMGVNRFGHCLTVFICIRVPLVIDPPFCGLVQLANITVLRL